MLDIYIKPLFIGLVLFSCLLAWTHSRHMPGRYDAQYAGRSEKEFRDVQSTVRDLEMTILKSRMSDSEAEAVIQDEHSEAYKNILFGKIGDILLTSHDAKLWLDAAKGSKRRKRKIYNFRNYPDRKWDLPIKYYIDTDTLSNVTEQAIIEKALKGWEKETCVRFEKASQFSTEQHLYFIQIESQGCSSYIGKAGYGDMRGEFKYSLNNQQPVHLAKDCFDSMGTVMHEIGHALGLYHEAQRLDRDEHVIVQEWNVISEDLSNFLQPADHSEIETKGLPYDIGSLMHYSALDFSIDVDDLIFTILPHDRDKVFVLGQRVEIGFYDAEAINLAYCPVSNTLACSNGGYTDPNNESQCKCPAGWQGTVCTEVQEGAQGCSPLSGFIDHHDADYGQTFSLYSPNYRNPVNWQYKKGDECYWYLQVPSKYQIAWWIGHDSDNSGTGYFLGLPAEKSGCQFWLEVKTPDEVRGIRTCMLLNHTENTLTDPHLSNSHKLLVSFRTFSEFYLPMDDVFLRGFHLQYELRPYTPQTAHDPYFWDKIDSLQSTYRPPFWHYTPKFMDYTPLINLPTMHNWDEYGHTSENEGNLSTGAIVGITLAGIIVVCLKVWCIVARVHRRQKVIVRRQILIEEHAVPRSRVANSSGQPGLSHDTTTTPSSSTAPCTAPPSYESATSSGTPQVNNQNNNAPQGTVTGTSINSRPRPVASGHTGIRSLRKGDLVVTRTYGQAPPATNRSQTDNAETPAPTYSNTPLSLLRVDPSLLSNC